MRTRECSIQESCDQIGQATTYFSSSLQFQVLRTALGVHLPTVPVVQTLHLLDTPCPTRSITSLAMASITDDVQYEASPQGANVTRHQREETADAQVAPACLHSQVGNSQPSQQEPGQSIEQHVVVHPHQVHPQQQHRQQHYRKTCHVAEYRSAAVDHHNFEYLDHTADVQLHAWGRDLSEAFEQVGLAMYNCMTPIDDLNIDAACTRQISASGHDFQSLLFAFLDELLFVYSTEYIMMKHISITALDTTNFTVTASCCGEKFDRSRHASGTEVKAVTFSAMQIRQAAGDAEVFVVVDI